MKRSSLLKMSEATSLAMHAMAILASEPGRAFSVREIAEVLNVSEAHLSKVLQRLSKAGFANSVRGPKGGFVTELKSEQIRLLDIYELFEGPIANGRCLLGLPRCDGRGCVMNDFIGELNEKVREFLAGTKLSGMKITDGRPS